MIKIAIKYEIFPSINDLNTFISGCHYGSDPDQLYFKTGTWQIPKGPLYADAVTFKETPKTVSGLGIFKDTNDEVPGLIFSHDWQEVFICDKTLTQSASKRIDKTVIFIEIPYEEAFKSTFNFERSLTDTKKEME
jgi:hypothetical protein